MHRLTYYLSFTLLYIIFSLILIRLSPSRINKNANFRILLVGLISVFVSAIRMNTGSDYWSYYVIYNNALRNDSLLTVFFDRANSPGLYLTSFLLKSYADTLGWDSALEKNLLFAVTALVTISLMFHLIKKKSRDFKMSMIIFFLMGYYMISNNLLKQEIAMVAMMFAFYALLEKKFIKYVLLCSLAVFFHVTAIIPAVLFPIASRINLSKSTVHQLLLLGIVASFLILFIGGALESISLFGYQKYFSSFDVYAQAGIGKTYALGLFLAYYIIYIYLHKYRRPLNLQDNSNRIYTTLLVIGLFFNALALNYWLLIRISLYFYQFFIIQFPNIILASNPSKYSLRKIYLALITFAIFYVLFSMDNHYFAYHTIFNEDMEPAFLDDYIYKYEQLR